MANYTVNPDLVLASPKAIRFRPNILFPPSTSPTSARPNINTAGAAITAGQPIYQDPDTFAFYPAEADGADPLYKVLGMAENSAAIGQPVSVVTEDPEYTPGFTMLIGDTIILSGTPGRVCPDADKTSGWKVAVLMVAFSTTQARLKIIRSDVAKA